MDVFVASVILGIYVDPENILAHTQSGIKLAVKDIN